MNPAYWRVTYTLTRPVPRSAPPDSTPETRDFTQDSQQTAYQKVQDYVRGNPSWRGARVTTTTITLADGVDASDAVQDLMAPASANLYAFECYIAASLLQFVGVWHSMDDATFDRAHADIRIVLYHRSLNRDPELHMGGRQASPNLRQLGGGSITLREIRDDPADRGLRRGDWVVLDNRAFVTRGVFQRENATYLGHNRFHGHGIDVTESGGPGQQIRSSVFTIDQYADHLANKPGVNLTADQVLDQVIVRPMYRAP
jgi:hypothetical protein